MTNLRTLYHRYNYKKAKEKSDEIIIFVASGFEERKEELLNLRLREFFPKPINMKAVINWLEQIR